MTTRFTKQGGSALPVWEDTPESFAATQAVLEDKSEYRSRCGVSAKSLGTGKRTLQEKEDESIDN